MQRLVLHIGYPKTATTTIQNRFLYPLHKENKINFLGKAIFKGVNFNPSGALIRRVVRQESIESRECLIVKNDMINVISNEDISLSFYNIDNQKYLPVRNPLETPFLLKKELMSFGFLDGNVEVIAVIRNQVDLIYSMYVEGYRLHFRHEPSLDSFDKYINQGMRNKKSGVFLMFYYFDVLEAFSKVFGKNNVHILFFEDLVNDKEFFCKRVASLCDVDSSMLASAVRHFDNVKERTHTGNLTPSISMMDAALGFVAKHGRFRDALRQLKNYKVFQSMVDLTTSVLSGVSIQKGNVVPYLNDEITHDLFKMFLDGNRRLVDDYGLDYLKMKKYGYL